LLAREVEQWVIAPPIPVEIDDVNASPLFGVAVHAIHTVGPAASRKR